LEKKFRTHFSRLRSNVESSTTSSRRGPAGGGSGWIGQSELFPSLPILIQMTAITKKILIETECREVFIVRAGGKNELRGYCEGCCAEGELVTFDEAVSQSGMPTLEIFARVQIGEIHSCETARGHLLICLRSLTPGLHFGSTKQEE
jgi:hypothetical protein